MGIYILNMEMPKDGRITIQIGADGAVYFVEECTILAEKYEKSSHAMPLPAGHGRLIDGERFRVILCRLTERQDDDSATHALRWAIECLDKLESLVDAEEENK